MRTHQARERLRAIVKTVVGGVIVLAVVIGPSLATALLPAVPLWLAAVIVGGAILVMIIVGLASPPGSHDSDDSEA